MALDPDAWISILRRNPTVYELASHAEMFVAEDEVERLQDAQRVLNAWTTFAQVTFVRRGHLQRGER